MAKLLKDGRIRIWLSNSGLGWLAFNFTVKQSIALRELLIVNTPPNDAHPNLSSNEGGDGSAH